MRIKWYVWTVMFALLPILMRVLVAEIIVAPTPMAWLQTSDINCFGLVLAVAGISSLGHEQDFNPILRTLNLGISMFFAAVFGVLFGLAALAEAHPTVIDRPALTTISLGTAVVMFMFGAVMWERYARFHERRRNRD